MYTLEEMHKRSRGTAVRQSVQGVRSFTIVATQVCVHECFRGLSSL